MTDELKDRVQALLTGNAGATVRSDANFLRSRMRKIAGVVELLRGTRNLLQARRTLSVKARLKQDAFESRDQGSTRFGKTGMFTSVHPGA